MFALRLLGGATSGTLAWLGADQIQSHGPDFLGIAALITAISGLIGVIGGIFLGMRRKPSDATDAVLLAMARRLTETDEEDE